MEYNFLGFIMVDEQNPRSKMQIIGIIAFIIAILIELLFSNYFTIFTVCVFAIFIMMLSVFYDIFINPINCFGKKL